MDDVITYDELPENLQFAAEHASSAASARVVADAIAQLGHEPTGDEMERVVRQPLVDHYWKVAYLHYLLVLKRHNSEAAMAVFCGMIGMYAGKLTQAHLDAMKSRAGDN